MPAGPTLRAESRTSSPPPEPRSRTVSPGLRLATAKGLPQPRLARSAASGASSVLGYAAAPKHPSANAPGSQSVGAPPARAVRAKPEYRSMTASRVLLAPAARSSVTGRSSWLYLGWLGGDGASHHDVGGGGEAVHARVVDPVVRGRAPVLGQDEPHVRQDLEMGGHGGLPDVDGGDDRTDIHRSLVAGEQGDYLDPGGVGEGTEPGGVLGGCGPAERLS